jgi:hypothetical protein
MVLLNECKNSFIIRITIFFVTVSSISHSQTADQYQCAANKTPSGCPNTVALFKFMHTSMNAANGGALHYDAAKGERLAVAAHRESTAKPDCLKGAIACGLIGESQNSHQIINDAQKLGTQLKNSIGKINTLEEGETIGSSEKKSDAELTTGISMDIEEESNSTNDIVNDQTWSTGQGLELMNSVKFFFMDESNADNWEKGIADLFGKFLTAFSTGINGMGGLSGFTGFGTAVTSFIPVEVHRNFKEAEEIIRILGTLDPETIKVAVEKFAIDAQTFGNAEAIKKFREKYFKG